MSTRWYPIYQMGNPQLRIFLPNFWMKIIKNEDQKQPPNVVMFQCSMEMTRYDIKNYLEKIYNINVCHVKMRIQMGTFRKEYQKGYVLQEDDKKIAYVSLPKNETFVFPDVCPDKTKKEIDKEKKNLDDTKENFKKYLEKNKQRPGLPSWFSF